MALISFDLDGVLQRNPFLGKSPDGVFGHIRRELAPYVHGVQQSAEAELSALGLVLAEHQARLHDGRLVGAHDWNDIVAVVGARLGYPGQIDVTAVVTDYCERPGLAYAYSGAHQCLAVLQEAGHRLISITNGFRCYQEPVLRSLGLLDYFAAVITPDVVRAAKPQEAIFRAAESYGCPRIHVGDTLPHDVAGARRAGWKAIYVVQPGAPGATDLPPELRALPPWERPAASTDWLAFRLELDRLWHGHPPALPDEVMPDAIVHHLDEIPPTVAEILR